MFNEKYKSYVLFDYRTPQTKILRTDSSDTMYVHNCTEVEVKQPQDAIDAFYKGNSFNLNKRDKLDSAPYLILKEYSAVGTKFIRILDIINILFLLLITLLKQIIFSLNL